MKIFLDTANIAQIREAYSWGVVDGVTTNPTIISREGKKFKDVVSEICQIVDGPISVEVVSTKHEKMIREAKTLASMHENIVVKIPMTVDGLKAVSALSRAGVKTNMTLVFSPNQALLAAKAGATYVSPFIGRLDDIGHEGMALVAKIVQIYRNYEFNTEIIVASVRHPMHVVEAALIGADICTVPYSVLEKMVRHPLTALGIDRFLSDWKKVPQ